jgi:methoxymalonate biosynthesis acyl carrier protein
MSVDQSRQSIKDNIRGFILRAARLRTLKDDEELFSSGLVTSLFAMQLIQHIEREYPLFVEGEDMSVKTFRSVEAVSDYVLRKLDANTAAMPQDTGHSDAA